jgi:drug/metabolite transporter (DMT)-like permease
MPRDPRARLLLAFAAVYIIWGSTYLAIRFAIETLPPFTMAAIRFLIAGGVLYAWGRLRGDPAPTRREWRGAAVIGGLLLLGGNGGVVWAEQYVASGLAALFVGAEPLWAVLLDWARPGGTRPSGAVIFGLLIGFAGVALLVAPADAGAQGTHLLGALALIVATISWAVGSIYSRHAPVPASPLMSTGSKMLAGGALLLVAAGVTGEPLRFDAGAVSARSVLALLYLIVFGAIAGFTAYIYLLKHTTLAKASTYAYVNPVVALFLGWMLAGEPLTARTLVATAVILGGVATINLGHVAVASRRLMARGGAMLRAGLASRPEQP